MPLESIQRLSEQFDPVNTAHPQELLPGAGVFQRDQVSDYEASVYEPVICLVLQGKKEIQMADQSVTLTQGDALIVSHRLPVLSKILSATPAKPYRSLVFMLNLGILRSLAGQVRSVSSHSVDPNSLSSSPADPTWLDPMARYLQLANDPVAAEVLGPMILKEIHFRMLTSHIGGMLRSLLAVDSHASKISKSIMRLRENFRTPLVVPDLAREVGMSASSFHEHFKSVTGTTPLQYQKDLRMIEAQSLLRLGGKTVSEVGFDVGYESPTHFSRDYSRKFGCSPKTHLA